MRAWLTRRRLASCVVAAGTFLLPACKDGHLDVFGYTSEPPYDCSIQTVYVPIPRNLTYRRGLEFDLKRAIDREIESKTPYRVSSNPDNADTELFCKIIGRTKNVVVLNQNNEVRDAETTLAVEVTWKDLRLGHVGDVLTKPPLPGQAEIAVVDPLTPPPAPAPLLITVPSNFVPELGGSITTAEKQMVDRLAVEIVSKMEKRW